MLRPRSSSRGGSLLEFLLIYPFLLLLIINAVNFGSFLFAWITVADAARAGAQYMVLGGATVTAPTTPTAAQVTAVVLADMASLRNVSTATVRVCKNNNGTATCSGTGSSTLAADPEPQQYVIGSVEVNYSYTPVMPAYAFPKLNFYLTLPPSAIRRTTVMRMLQ